MQAYARKGVSRCLLDDEGPISQLGHARGEAALRAAPAPLLSSYYIFEMGITNPDGKLELGGWLFSR